MIDPNPWKVVMKRFQIECKPSSKIGIIVTYLLAQGCYAFEQRPHGFTPGLAHGMMLRWPKQEDEFVEFLGGNGGDRRALAQMAVDHLVRLGEVNAWNYSRGKHGALKPEKMAVMVLSLLDEASPLMFRAFVEGLIYGTMIADHDIHTSAQVRGGPRDKHAWPPIITEARRRMAAGESRAAIINDLSKANGAPSKSQLRRKIPASVT